MKKRILSCFYAIVLVLTFSAKASANVTPQEAMRTAALYLHSLDHDIDKKIKLDLVTSLSQYRFDGKRYQFLVWSKFSIFCSLKVAIFAQSGVIESRNTDQKWSCYSGS